ncbi:uncharacterized protein PG998_014082 [Apiospora kogelbergensis]|uniref:uncharacterized protein n=1 Tax=Apiospora kogelbergensis TaxID=1337665 RepID=UPI0031302550
MSDAAAPDPRNKGRWVLIWELGRDDYRLRGVFSGTEAATSGRRAPLDARRGCRRRFVASDGGMRFVKEVEDFVVGITVVVPFGAS